MMDEDVEFLLKDREVFEIIMPKALSFLRGNSVIQKLRMYELMSMRLGHTTGKKMLFKDIARKTLNLKDNNTPVSNNYCSMMYRRGLSLSRRAIKTLETDIFSRM